jgi:hypothetical protein
MIAPSASAVATEFCSSWRPASPGERVCAMTPEPTTAVTSSAVPTSSASSRRHSTGEEVMPAR